MELLVEQASKSNCDIHARCPMTNHVHLLVSPHHANSASLLMKGVIYKSYVWSHRKFM
ncbi:transposase [Pseudomonas sp. PS01299]|uniref:transposase n=1 Tax=Pseudomonas sp. PS01299 TaxID=2991435 RepID=UPI00249A8096|nr:transposase [Pseudomonas sp. PS01299]